MWNVEPDSTRTGGCRDERTVAAVVWPQRSPSSTSRRSPDTSDVTAATAVESARRVLADDVESGFQTPVTAFGADHATEFDGVRLDRVEAPGSASIA